MTHFAGLRFEVNENKLMCCMYQLNIWNSFSKIDIWASFN